MSIDSRIPFDRSSSFGAGSLGMRKFRKIDSFSHSRNRVRQDRSQEAVGADEHLGLAFERRPGASSSSSRVVGRHAPSRIGSSWSRLGLAEEELDELLDVRPRVNLVAVQVGLQIVQLVRVGLLAEDVVR